MLSLSFLCFPSKKYPTFQLSHKWLDHCPPFYWNHPILNDWNVSVKKAKLLLLVFLPFSNKSPQGKGSLKRSLNRGFPSPLKRLPQGSGEERGRSGGRGYLYFTPWCYHLESSKTSKKEGNGCRVHTVQGDQRQPYPRYTCPKLNMGVAESRYSSREKKTETMEFDRCGRTWWQLTPVS